MLNKSMVKKAKAYREENNRQNGIVLFFHGNIYGWKNELRNPECEQPGAVAIDRHGNQWVASGGDPYNGADRWEQIWQAGGGNA